MYHGAFLALMAKHICLTAPQACRALNSPTPLHEQVWWLPRKLQFAYSKILVLHKFGDFGPRYTCAAQLLNTIHSFNIDFFSEIRFHSLRLLQELSLCASCATTYKNLLECCHQL